MLALQPSTSAAAPSPAQHPRSSAASCARAPCVAAPAAWRAGRRPHPAVAAAAVPAAAEAHVGAPVDWAVEVTRHTLTLPQVLEHLEQLDRIEAAARGRGTSSSKHSSASSAQHRVSWVEHATSAAASLMEGILSDSESSSEDDLLAAVAALPPHLLTDSQKAAVVLQAWEGAAHTKPAGFDADARLTLPGLADVAVVSRGGWQRHSWKNVNQDAFLALPLAPAGPPLTTCADCATVASCCSAAVAVGVFDGHGRAGAAASAHLRNALASGLLMHSQLAQAAQKACARGGRAAPHGAPATAAEQQEEAAQLLERCFAAAASTMPSTGADFSMSGSTAVLCLVQPGAVTAAWSGDSRAVLGLHHPGGRYIACALTADHKPASPLERARIEGAGGWVMQTLVDESGQPAGPHRVYLRDTNIPGLAVSRCFGDYVATAAGVTSTPDVVTLVLPTRQDSSHKQQQQQERGRQHGRAQHGRTQSSGQGGGSSSRSRSRRGGPKGQQQQQQEQCTAGGSHPGAHAPAGGRAQHPGGAQAQGRKRQGGPRGPAPAPAAGRGGGHSVDAGSGPHHILIVASDGLWEFVSNAEAVRIASKCPTAQAAAEALVLEAQAQWAVKFAGAHCDDITVAAAFLPAA